jgi:hypothetical protein
LTIQWKGYFVTSIAVKELKSADSGLDNLFRSLGDMIYDATESGQSAIPKLLIAVQQNCGSGSRNFHSETIVTPDTFESIGHEK